MRDTGLNEAIRAVGGVSELARKIGIAQPSVSNWTRVPAERVLAVEEVTGVSRITLRPDLYRSDTTSSVDDVDMARATEYRLLAGLLARAPDTEFLNRIATLRADASPLGIAHAALAERGIPLASNQVEYSLLHRAPEVNGLLDACRELGVTLIADQPLAQGVLTGKYRPGDRPKGIRRFGRYFRGDGLEKAQPVVDLLGEIGERYSRSPAQVALRWLMEKERVLPIPGAKTGRQAASNAGALSFSLADAEIKALDRATTPWRR